MASRARASSQGIGRALVKLHDDVRAEFFLDGDGRLRSEKVAAAVQMGAKLHALLAHLAKVGQRKDLKTAAVGQDGPVPAHKAVQAAGAGNEILARAQVKMVGVGEDDLRADVLEFIRGHGLNRGLRAHGHVDGRFDNAVGRVQTAAARAGLLADVQKFKFKGLGQFVCPPLRYERRGAKKTATCAGRRETPVRQAARRRSSLAASASAATAITAAATPTGRESSPDLGTVSSMTRAAMSMLRSISPFASKASRR